MCTQQIDVLKREVFWKEKREIAACARAVPHGKGRTMGDGLRAGSENGKKSKTLGIEETGKHVTYIKDVSINIFMSATINMRNAKVHNLNFRCVDETRACARAPPLLQCVLSPLSFSAQVCYRSVGEGSEAHSSHTTIFNAQNQLKVQ